MTSDAGPAQQGQGEGEGGARSAGLREQYEADRTLQGTWIKDTGPS